MASGMPSHGDTAEMVPQQRGDVGADAHEPPWPSEVRPKRPIIDHEV
jgi:hypothetical protein